MRLAKSAARNFRLKPGWEHQVHGVPGPIPTRTLRASRASDVIGSVGRVGRPRADQVGARLTKAEGFSAVVPFQAPQPSAPRSHTVTVAEQPRSGKLRHDRGDRAAGAQREDRYERQSSKQLPPGDH